MAYRAGIDSRNNELMLGYYFDILNRPHHFLITYDNDLWTNFIRGGFNSTISFAKDLYAFSYSSDLFLQNDKVRYIPGAGISVGYNDLISAGVFYNFIDPDKLNYPNFEFKLIIRPAFIGVLFQNPNGSDW